MIKFFRKIRQNMIIENKVSKYLLYALGEIILVVIGILIALQINNWNQQRNDRNIEKIVYKTLIEDLALDTLDMMYNISVNKNIMNVEKGLLALMQGKKVDSLDLKNALGHPLILEFHKSGFERITQVDTDVITNDKLKNEITRHYDFYYPAVKRFEDEFMTAYYDRKLKAMQDHLIIDSEPEEVNQIKINSDKYYKGKLIRRNYTIKNKRELRNNNALKVLLSESSFFRQTLLGFYNGLFAQNRVLIKEIKLELRKLENR